MNKIELPSPRLLWWLLPPAAFAFKMFKRILLAQVRKKLSQLEGLHVQVDDLIIARGGAQVKLLRINISRKTGRKDFEPLAAAEEIEINLDRRKLKQGIYQGAVNIRFPFVELDKKEEPKSEKKKAESSSSNPMEQLAEQWPVFSHPLIISSFNVKQGKFIFEDQILEEQVRLQVEDIEVSIINITTEPSTEPFPTLLFLKAGICGGELTTDVKLNLTQPVPCFDLTTQLRHLDLTQLNSALRAYTDMDVHKGSFELYTEVAVKDGKFKGYLKPFLHDLEMKGPDDKHDSLINRAKETVVAMAASVLKNKSEDQIATRIPFEGEFTNPKLKVGVAIAEVLRNAFLRALTPKLDYNISLGSLLRLRTDSDEEQAGDSRK